MPRSTPRGQTQTNALPAARGRRPQLDVVAPLNVRTPYKGADALLSALGIGGEIATQKAAQAEQDNAASGALDAQTGTVDPKKYAKSRAYQDTYVATQAEAKFITAEGKFREWYQKDFDKARGLPGELNAKIDEFYTQEFADAKQDPRVAAALVKRMGRFREEMLGTQQAEVKAAVEQEQIAAVGTIMRDKLLKGEAVDPEELMAKLRPVVGNSKASKAFVDLVGTTATEAGAPELLDALIPEKWNDGTPGARAVPDLLNAINQYKNWAEGAANARREDAKKAAAVGRDKAMRELTLIGLRTNPTGRAEDMLKHGLITDDDFQQIVSRFRTNRDDNREQSLNMGDYSSLRKRLAEDPSKVPSSEIAQFVGSLPPGDKSVNLANGLWDDYEQAMRSERMDGARLTPKAQAFLDTLRTKYSTTDEEDRIGYADMLLDFRKKVLDGGDPAQAYEEAQSFMDSTDTTKSPAGDIETDAKKFAAGSLTPQAFLRSHRTVSPDDIDSLVKSKKLTREQAAQLLNQM